jgi:hypothetical protein
MGLAKAGKSLLYLRWQLAAILPVFPKQFVDKVCEQSPGIIAARIFEKG